MPPNKSPAAQTSRLKCFMVQVRFMFTNHASLARVAGALQRLIRQCVQFFARERGARFMFEHLIQRLDGF